MAFSGTEPFNDDIDDHLETCDFFILDTERTVQTAAEELWRQGISKIISLEIQYNFQDEHEKKARYSILGRMINLNKGHDNIKDPIEGVSLTDLVELESELITDRNNSSKHPPKVEAIELAPYVDDSRCLRAGRHGCKAHGCFRSGHSNRERKGRWPMRPAPHMILYKRVAKSAPVTAPSP